MHAFFARAAVLLVGLQLCGCITDFGPIIVEEGGGGGPLSVAPRLQRGDRIKVTVYGEDNLNGVYDVDPAGFVSIPLAGTIRVAGRSKSELEQEITRKYRSEYLKDPKVTVDFAAFRPIYIMGEAERPGEYPYKSGTNLLSAVSTAGGFTYRASRQFVLIQHAGEDVWRETPLSVPVQILPGDIIRIPERFF